MQLVYVIDSLAPAGTERSLVALAPEYRARGVALEVVYLRDRDDLRPELIAAGARVISLSGRGGRLGNVRRVRTYLGERRPDLVHTSLFEADVAGRVAARLVGIPVVSTFVNEEYGPAHVRNPNLRPWKVRAAQALDAATCRFVRRFHSVSGHVADVMARRLAIPRARIDVVPRGRDPVQLGERSRDRRARARQQLGLTDDERVVLAVARHDYQKGLDVLVEALASVRAAVPGTRLLVAGRAGQQTAELGDRARGLGVDAAMTLLGKRDDVADLLCAADVSVLPSRREGMPGSLLEAMALETPIVASDLPQIREVVDERSALLVEPQSPEALAGAIASTLRDPEGAARRAAVARVRFVEHFTIDRVAEKMLDFYRRALG